MDDDAAAVLQRYLHAQRDKDLEALVSCWHEDVEAVHPLRPDRSWRGRDTYRRQWERIWSVAPETRFEVVSTAVSGNTIYLEALTQTLDGSMVPHMNVLEVEGGRIRRARVYTDKPTHDGLSMDDFSTSINSTS
jgi:ketosteroid isomerase-like protein